MSRFDTAVAIILVHEGGFTNDVHDPGGATDFGISLRFLKSHGIDINDDGQINLLDIRDLTVDKAKEIYKTFWWDKYHYESIISFPIATKVFDMAVNMGGQEAHKIAQETCRYLGYKIPLDGIIGPLTINALNDLYHRDKEDYVINDICESQKHFYEDLAAEKPALKKFLKGWLNRAAYKGA